MRRKSDAVGQRGPRQGDASLSYTFEKPFMMIHRRFLIVLLILTLGHVVADGGEHWPRFRGPNGAGVNAAGSVPVTWAADDYQWIVDLPGTGCSSPVIWGQTLFVTAADESKLERYLICIDAETGKQRWRKASSFAQYKKHKNNSYAASSPTVDAEQVYVLWHAREASLLIAYSHAGDESWRCDLGPYLHGQGGATSPIVHGDLVVVAHDHKAESFLVAVDRKTGEVVWKIPRAGKRACYATPCVRRAETGGDEFVFVHCYEGIVGVAAKTGKLRWHVDVFGRESQRALASPIVYGDLVIAGSGGVGGERKIVAVEVAEGAGAATEKYRVTRQAPHVPTPLIVGDGLYLWSDSGIVTRCDAATGKVAWQKRIGGNFFASPICVGKAIYNVSTDGEVVVIAAADQFDVLGKQMLEEGTRASLASAGNRLYLRTESRLFALGQE